MDYVNAIVLLLNYIFVPALSYGSQLALGAIFVSLIYGILRFAYFTAGDLMSFGTMFTILFTWYFQSLGISLGVLPTALIAIPLLIQTYGIFFLAYSSAKLLKLKHAIAAPACLIGTSNFFELAVAVAISLFGLNSGAALATVVGVLVEVPVMLSLVFIANRTRHLFPD